MSVFILLLPALCGVALSIAFHTWLAIWVVKDVRARGAGAPGTWALAILLLGLLAFVLYLLVRPNGQLVECRHCYNRKLEIARACPHCGFSGKRARGAYA